MNLFHTFAVHRTKIKCPRVYILILITGVFFKFGVEVGVEVSIVNALYRLRITDQLFKSYAFTRVVRSQSTLQRLLRRKIKKTPFICREKYEYVIYIFFKMQVFSIIRSPCARLAASPFSAENDKNPN
jgi:hypothetical protein